MPHKSKIEQAVEERASGLDPALREIVLSQFQTYKWNRSRMAQIECAFRMADAGKPTADPASLRDMAAERSQLAAVNEEIASGLLRQLGAVRVEGGRA